MWGVCLQGVDCLRIPRSAPLLSLPCSSCGSQWPSAVQMRQSHNDCLPTNNEGKALPHGGGLSAAVVGIAGSRLWWCLAGPR